jgi:hypothetical protein
VTLPLPDDARVTLTVGELRAMLEEAAGTAPEENPQPTDRRERLVSLWRDEATRHLLRGDACEDESSGARASGRKA